MADSKTTATDIQDPLPESNWFWRRVFIFAFTAIILFFMWGGLDRIGKVATVAPVQGIPALVTVSKWLIGLCWFSITYYLLAPSAEQMTKMFKTATLLKSGVQVASRRVVHEPNRIVDEASTIAQPPQPEIPAPATAVEPRPEVTSKGKPTEIIE